MSLALLLSTELSHAHAAGYEVIGMSAPGPYVERLEQIGIAHFPLASLTRSWDPVRDVRAFRELIGALRTLRPDVLHTHNPKTGVMGRIAGRLVGVPVVVNTCHGLWAKPEDSRRRRAAVVAMEAVAARFSDYELFQNAQDERTMRMVLKPGRHHVVGNGIDLRHFVPDPEGRERLRAQWGVGPGELVVGTVARIVSEKGITEFTAAAEALGHRARFVWVGQDDDSAGSPPEHHPAVQFVGEYAQMPAVYSAFDVFVLASYREGFSRASMEAAACGVAMVLTDIRGCREIGTHEQELLFAPVQDAPALTEAIERLLEDSALRARLAAAARVRALGNFDQGSVAEASITTYRHLAGRRTAKWQRA